MISETYWDALTKLEEHVARVESGLARYRNPIADIELKYVLESVIDDRKDREELDVRTLFEEVVEAGYALDVEASYSERLLYATWFVDRMKGQG
jgi:hypothetical protein